MEASIAARVAIKSLLLCDCRLMATLTCEKSHIIMICVRAEHARLEPYVKEEKRCKTIPTTKSSSNTFATI